MPETTATQKEMAEQQDKLIRGSMLEAKTTTKTLKGGKVAVKTLAELHADRMAKKSLPVEAAEVPPRASGGDNIPRVGQPVTASEILTRNATMDSPENVAKRQRESMAAVPVSAAESATKQAQDKARFVTPPERPPVEGITAEVKTEPIPVAQIDTVLDQSVGLTPTSPIQDQVPAPMPESNTPIATGQYREAPNTSADPIGQAINPPNAALMPNGPGTLNSGKIVSIIIEAAEFDDKRGSLDYRVSVNVGGTVHVRHKQIGINHFRGYFAQVWSELGDDFKRAVEEATS